MTIPAHLFNNPLVNPPVLPYGAPPYGLIEAAHIIPAIEWAIDRQKADIVAIRNDPALPTFENTAEALEFSGSDLTRIEGIVSTIFFSKTSDQLRAIKEIVDEKTTKAGNDIWMDDVLFARLDALHAIRASLGLTPEKNRLLEKQHRGFVDTGVNLDPVKKQRVKAISERLSVLANQFRKNEAESTAAFEKYIDDPADLDGVAQDVLDQMAKDAADAGQPGKWLVKLDPSPAPLLKYCKNRALREEIFRASYNIAAAAPYDNRPLALEMIRLQHEMAQIKGYKTYAAMTLSDQMAKDPQTVNNFISRALQVYRPAANEYVDKVRKFVQSEYPNDRITDLQAWDYRYYSNLYKEKNCQFDSRDFEKYLDLEKVLDGLRTHLKKQFGIELHDETARYSTYDPDVRVYEVHRKDGGGIVGLFYADYYARGKAKNSGAWMQEVRSRCSRHGIDMIPIVTNNLNFVKPLPGKPTFITLDDYITLYHEMGHGLHGLLSRSQYPSLAGTHVKTDWVEGPSQFQENFALQKEVLDTFAVHHDTQQRIPESLIKAANDYKYFDAGWQGLRQISFCLMDMKSYDVDPATIPSLDGINADVESLTGILPPVPGCQMAAFTHIFGGGYEAGYYSYKWAEVTDKHLFQVTTKNGLYDPAAMKLVEEHLYGSGDMRDPMESFIAMTGTKPDPDMLFRHEGLLPLAAPVFAAAPLPKPGP